jgi:hypothetical protein
VLPPLRCWRHEINERPTFDQLCEVLDDARPEQVQAVTSASLIDCNLAVNSLDFCVGDVVTVLDKENGDLWCGAHNANGKVRSLHTGCVISSATVGKMTITLAILVVHSSS